MEMCFLMVLCAPIYSQRKNRNMPFVGSVMIEQSLFCVMMS